ncbi:MAG: DUF5602 domain-containing protein [Gemmatimonadaceae bacterium]
MSRSRFFTSASLALAISLVACVDPAVSTASKSRGAATDASLDRAGYDVAGTHRQYGTPFTLGNGIVRTYVVLDDGNSGRPLEVGVAMSEQSLDGLPAGTPMAGSMSDHSHHVMSNVLLLDLPAQNPTPFKFVQFDWNPNGHEPDSVYTLPHFDFHFYTVPVEVRNSIVPSDPQYGVKAANLPAMQYRSSFYIDGATAAGGIPAASATVPLMGLHWLDVRSPEIQKLAGNPGAWQPFTKTFLRGSWNGQFIFEEPMITRAYILAKKTATEPSAIDEIIPLPMAQAYSPAGYYPTAYRVTWDAQQKEYRIALTQLRWRE